MHTFSPAKMWIRGLRSCASPAAPGNPGHVEIPWDSIDMDFMNLNQAAHGDREYAYILTRLGLARATVVGHARRRTPVVASPTGCARPAASRRPTSCACRRSATTCATWLSREGDKTEAEVASASRSTRGRSTTSSPSNDAVDEAAIDALVAEYRERYELHPNWPRVGIGRSRCAAREEIALRTFLEARGRWPLRPT